MRIAPFFLSVSMILGMSFMGIARETQGFLTQEDICHFYEQGYVLKKTVFDSDGSSPVV